MGVEAVFHLHRGESRDGQVRRPARDVPEDQVLDGLRHVPAGQPEVPLPPWLGRQPTGAEGKLKMSHGRRYPPSNVLNLSAFFRQ